ncbi:hypothetical protein [Leptotrichia sp. oral taxon 223]|uniref:hypothetical protein n=1 Tax=Leptotrichia sp. oral taxon 223 TaxID=712363 RepID=UPI0015BFBA8D|nr:hypothetical protein [Leptotrichia sp. oral taxon 223]NWO18837.1 hypothetical protein [Leptotrichia sp. oral taxon 223]
MVILKNKEKGKILLVELNHILLKEGDNELDLTPRRLNIAKEEIEKRKLNIEIIELGDENAVQVDDKTKTKDKKSRDSTSNESTEDRSGDSN